MRMIIETVGEFDGVGAIGVIASRPDGSGTNVSVTIAGKTFSVEAVTQIAERLVSAANRALSLAKEVEVMSDPALTRKIAHFDGWQKEQTAMLEQQRVFQTERAASLDKFAEELAEREAKLPVADGREADAEADPADPEAIGVK